MESLYKKYEIGIESLNNTIKSKISKPEINNFISTPNSKINIPVMQFEFDIANCMCQIPTNQATLADKRHYKIYKPVNLFQHLIQIKIPVYEQLQLFL